MKDHTAREVRCVRRIWIVLCFLLAAATLPACSWGSQPATGRDLLIPALGERPAGDMSCLVLYLNESVADRYVSATEGGDTEAFEVLYGLLVQAVEQPAQTVGALSPEAAGTHQILLADAAGNELISFYYIEDRNLLVYREEITTESDTEYTYRFYATDPAITDWLEAQRPAAESTPERTSLSPAQLVAAVDAGKLAQKGDAGRL
jgi:hypothetical protein